jgi:hypothetical protein
MASLVIAQAAGILRDMVWGRGEWLPQILSNLLGFLALIAVAYVAGWYKSQPWRKPPATSSTGPSERPKTPPADGGEPAAKAKAETREPALT